MSLLWFWNELWTKSKVCISFFTNENNCNTSHTINARRNTRLTPRQNCFNEINEYSATRRKQSIRVRVSLPRQESITSKNSAYPRWDISRSTIWAIVTEPSRYSTLWNSYGVATMLVINFFLFENSNFHATIWCRKSQARLALPSVLEISCHCDNGMKRNGLVFVRFLFPIHPWTPSNNETAFRNSEASSFKPLHPLGHFFRRSLRLLRQETVQGSRIR